MMKDTLVSNNKKGLARCQALPVEVKDLEINDYKEKV